MRTIFRIILAVVAAVVSAAEAKGYTLADEQARTTPDWFRKGVMYQIQPRAFTAEGTIKAAEAKLPELAAMGVTVVYMCPVTAADDDPREDMWSPRQVKSGFNNPRNPYRTGDYFHVDPEYGTDEDLRSFVKAAHANGVKVLLDMVFLHCGPSARVLKDHPEYFSYDKDGKIVMEGWRFPKLDFTNRAVHEYFKANMVYWLADFDVDGFRCDVADCIPLDFWEEARDVCERIKDGIVILAEGCRHANTRHAFDANYNWPVCLSWLRPILKSDSKEGYNQQWAAGGVDVSKFKGVAKLRAAAEQYAAKCPRGTLNMNFTENHDTVNDDYDFRMEKRCGWENQTLGLALCFAMDGIPLIYNGQEIADSRRHSIFGHSPEVTIDWTHADTDVGRRRREMVCALATLRRDLPSLSAPGQTWLDNDRPESVLALRRGKSDANAIVFVGNFSKEEVTVRVDSVAADKMEILLSNGAAAEAESFRLAPWGFAFAKERTAAAPLAEYPGEVGEKTGWKCVGSEEGKVVYIPFEGYYESKGGRIESPRFKLDGEIGKNRFYRLTFSAKCPVDGYWWVDFFDKDGVQLPDVNSRLYASEDWMPYDVVVPTHPAAAFGQIAFVARKGALAKDVSMRRASVAEAAKWCNDLMATLPKLDAPETADAWAKLPKTREKILSGKRVNIVFLGNSIVNDTWCGNVAALIQDALPKADLRCFISVRGSTGCGYYHEQWHFEEYVAKYEPDLVVIGGTSNYQGREKGETLDMAEGWLVETIERCKAIGAEVVVSTPPPSREFRADATPRPFDRSLTKPTEDEAYRWLYSCFEYKAAKRTEAQVWDLTTAPCDAISRSGKPLNWFKRDAAHNDDRGKQLIAQTLAAYFKAVKESEGQAPRNACTKEALGGVRR